MVRKTPGNDTSFQFRTETGGNEGSTTSDAGETTISVTVEGLDADGGAAIDASTTTDTLSVTAGLPSIEDGLPRPQDIDGDGDYEDLNGNDRLDSDDVVLYFNNYDQPVITDHVDAYDFNDTDTIDFDDIVTLFNEL